MWTRDLSVSGIRRWDVAGTSCRTDHAIAVIHSFRRVR